MENEFKNYSIEKGRVIISLEKDIYTKGMIDGAKQALSDECKISVAEKKGVYEITLVPKAKNADLEETAVMFNDTLISNFSLFPN
jgi:hypothetical protein